MPPKTTFYKSNLTQPQNLYIDFVNKIIWKQVNPSLRTTALPEKESWTWEELDEKILLNSRMASSKMVGFLYFSYLIQFNLFASENAISEKMRKKCTKNLQVNWDIMQDDVISFNGFPFCKCRKNSENLIIERAIFANCNWP